MSKRNLINPCIENPELVTNENEYTAINIRLTIEQIPADQCGTEKFICIGKKPAQMRTSLYDFCKSRKGRLFLENANDVVEEKSKKVSLPQQSTHPSTQLQTPIVQVAHTPASLSTSQQEYASPTQAEDLPSSPSQQEYYEPKFNNAIQNPVNFSSTLQTSRSNFRGVSGAEAFEKYSQLKRGRDELVIKVHEMKLEIKKMEAEMDNIKTIF